MIVAVNVLSAFLGWASGVNRRRGSNEGTWLGRTASRMLAAGSALTLAAGVVACGSSDNKSSGGGGGGGGGKKVTIGLITKTDTNPFFVKMKEGATAKAKSLGADLQSFAGKKDGDNESQVAAVESLISAGAKGLMITPSDSKAIVPALDKARQAGCW